MRLTSKRKHGAVFHSHKGVKRPSAAHGGVWIGAFGGARGGRALGAPVGGLGGRAALLRRARLGHFQSASELLAAPTLEIGGGRLRGPRLSTVGSRRGGSARPVRVVFVVVLGHRKRVPAG